MSLDWCVACTNTPPPSAGWVLTYDTTLIAAIALMAGNELAWANATTDTTPSARAAPAAAAVFVTFKFFVGALLLQKKNGCKDQTQPMDSLQVPALLAD